MALDSPRLKQLVLDEGIDLVGIADARSLVTSYPPSLPASLMPSARSVIVMAVPHSLGAVAAPDILVWTRNKMQTSRLLDQTAEKVARLLEKEGHLSLPISADKPVRLMKSDPETGRRFRLSRFAGHLSLKHAAVSCGMGQIGRSNLLLTPEFGPHQRLGGIITAAPLDPDRMTPPDLCLKGCRACETACPVGALNAGKYNVDPCSLYWSTGLKQLRPQKLRDWPMYVRMLISHARKRDLPFEIGQTFITDVDYCIECMRSCPVGSRWDRIRPESMPVQRHGCGGLDL
jgi:epoxyqueuosine reductase